MSLTQCFLSSLRTPSMKLPLILFILYFQDVICDDTDMTNLESKLLLRYPKKTNSYSKRKSKMLLSKKYQYEKTSMKPKERLPASNYTAFPAIGPRKAVFNIPDSLLFPMDHPGDHKTRVKKVLPDFAVPMLRKKRSVGKDQTKIVKRPPKRERHNKASDKKSAKRSSSRDQKHRAKPPKSGKSKLQRSRLRSNPKNKKQHKTSKPEPHKLRKGRRHHNKTKVNSVKSKAIKEDSRRLIAARDALIQQYPYTVSIQKNSEHWCAGALLNPRMVITTANCMWKSTRISRLKVRAGSRHTDRGGQVARIMEVAKHPSWSIRGNPDYDVALLLLDRRIKFSDSVHGVDLPNRVMLPAFEDAWITSWGAERRDGVVDKKSMTLQVFHARLLERGKCNNMTQRFGVSVSSNFICLSQSGKRAPCTRDTGAPAVSDGVLWGLASWGIRRLCGTERFPAMFSYLASNSNMDFIINATKTLMSDERFYPSLDRYVKPAVEQLANTPDALAVPDLFENLQ